MQDLFVDARSTFAFTSMEGERVLLEVSVAFFAGVHLEVKCNDQGRYSYYCSSIVDNRDDTTETRRIIARIAPLA